MESRKEQKDKTRHRLITEALELSASKGFAALSLREITKAAGITPAAFYRHFNDVDELGLVLLDEVGVSLRRLLRETRRRTGDGERIAEESVITFLEYVNEKPNLFRLFLGERQGASNAFRKAIRNEIERFVNELAEDLMKRKSKTRIGNFHFAAEAIVAIVFTIGAEVLDLPKAKQPALAERLTEQVRMVLRGARVSESQSV